MTRYVVPTLLLLVISILASVLLSYYIIPAEPSKNQSIIKPIVIPRSDPNEYKLYEEYLPAEMEAYEIEHAESQGYGRVSNYDPLNPTKNLGNMSSGCRIWNDAKHPIYPKAHIFLDELESYYQDVHSFHGIDDVRNQFTMDLSNRDKVCSQLNLRTNMTLLEGYFNRSQQLSFSRSGYIEPLFPPMRHPKFCEQRGFRYVLNLEYLIHDFAFMCRKLTKVSRLILFDFGASLSFHKDTEPPILSLISLYQKFGMPFDHIYAFEAKEIKPGDVYNDIPEPLLSAYHWYNVPITNDTQSKQNPLHFMKKLHPDDLVIVKLDIDTSTIEVPLAIQILNNTFDMEIIIDQFYFEHHVEMREIAGAWTHTMKGTIKESLELFQNLRKKGIASHFWV
jgi:hypothetical protein